MPAERELKEQADYGVVNTPDRQTPSRLERAGLRFARAFNGQEGDYWAYWKRIPIATGLGIIGNVALRQFGASPEYVTAASALATAETARLLYMHVQNVAADIYNRRRDHQSHT